MHWIIGFRIPAKNFDQNCTSNFSKINSFLIAKVSSLFFSTLTCFDSSSTRIYYTDRGRMRHDCDFELFKVERERSRLNFVEISTNNPPPPLLSMEITRVVDPLFTVIYDERLRIANRSTRSVFPSNFLLFAMFTVDRKSFSPRDNEIFLSTKYTLRNRSLKFYSFFLLNINITRGRNKFEFR